MCIYPKIIESVLQFFPFLLFEHRYIFQKLYFQSQRNIVQNFSSNKDKGGRNSRRLKCKNVQHCNITQSLSLHQALSKSLSLSLSFLFSQKTENFFPPSRENFISRQPTIECKTVSRKTTCTYVYIYIYILRSKKKDGWRRGGREKRIFWV